MAFRVDPVTNQGRSQSTFTLNGETYQVSTWYRLPLEGIRGTTLRAVFAEGGVEASIRIAASDPVCSAFLTPVAPVAPAANAATGAGLPLWAFPGILILAAVAGIVIWRARHH
jgi:hypothetical protein